MNCYAPRAACGPRRLGERRLSPRPPAPVSETLSFRDWIPAVKHHHEWYNGRGYPDGLEGDGIPLTARVLSVADAYDAMTSGRQYRDPIPSCETFDELAGMAGIQFDPAIVEAFSLALKNEKWRD